MSAAPRHLPIVAALPGDRFDCIKLRARLSHEACVARRTALHRHARPGVTPWPAYPSCATCEQGAGVEAALRATTVVRVAAPTQMSAMGRRERVPAVAPAPAPAPAVESVTADAPVAPPAPTTPPAPASRCTITGCVHDAAAADRRTAPEFTLLCPHHKREATRFRDGFGMSPQAAVAEIETRLATIGKPCPTRGCTGSAGRYAVKLHEAFRVLCFGCRNRACVTRTRRPEMSPAAIVEAMRASTGAGGAP